VTPREEKSRERTEGGEATGKGRIVVSNGMPSTGGPTGADSGLAPHVAAALAYLFGFVGGIVFLVLERQNRAVRFAAMQSILLFAAWLAAWIAYSILFAVLGLVPFVRLLVSALAAPVSFLVEAVFFVAWLLCVVRSFQGQTLRLPFLGELAERFLPAL